MVNGGDKSAEITHIFKSVEFSRKRCSDGRGDEHGEAEHQGEDVEGEDSLGIQKKNEYS